MPSYASMHVANVFRLYSTCVFREATAVSATPAPASDNATAVPEAPASDNVTAAPEAPASDDAIAVPEASAVKRARDLLAEGGLL